MKIYGNLNVSLSFQNQGTHYLGVLEGPQEEIELTFNGLFNLKATNGKLEYTGHTKTQATFWTSERQMRLFFFNRHILKFDSKKHANIYADMEMAKFRLTSRMFYDFRKDGFADSFGDGFTTGTSRAERPDNDYRDAVLQHAFKDKGSVEKTEKMLASL